MGLRDTPLGVVLFAFQLLDLIDEHVHKVLQYSNVLGVCELFLCVIEELLELAV